MDPTDPDPQHCFSDKIYVVPNPIFPRASLSPKLMRERIEHGMMWMDAGQPILLQLIRHNVHDLFHAAAVVCPVANDL
jgi:hypothetical protein